MDTTRDDAADFRDHPEWFSVTPISVRMLDPSLKDKYPEAYRNMVEACINPPIRVVRKPIPFVLPIRGSAL